MLCLPSLPFLGLIHGLLLKIFRSISMFLLLAGVMAMGFGVLIYQKEALAGIIFKQAKLDDVLKTLTDSLPDSFPDKLKSAGDKEIPKTELLEPIAVALIAFGSISMAFSILGIVLTYIDWQILWTVYIVCCTILATSCVCTAFIPESIKKHALYALVDDYKGLEDTEGSSLILNAVMRGFNCCGVIDFRDFNELDNWPPKDFNFALVTLQPQNGSNTPAFKTPIACCKNLTHIPYGCFVDGVANEVNNNMLDGCLEAIDDAMDKIGVNKYFIVSLHFLAGFYTVNAAVAYLFLITA